MNKKAQQGVFMSLSNFMFLPKKSGEDQKIAKEITEIIRSLGLKVTKQRFAILYTLLKKGNHFSAKVIFEDLKKDNTEDLDIGFATVYRFLRDLAKSGYITEIRIGGLPARYEWANQQHHDHLTCLNCHTIYEFENKSIERLQQQVALNFGFQLTDHLMELYGICSYCLEKGAKIESKHKYSPQISNKKHLINNRFINKKEISISSETLS